MALEHVAKNAWYLLLARVLEKASQFLVLLMVARAVANEAFGTYSLAIYFTALCSVLFDWGVSPYTVRQVALDVGQTLKLYVHGLALKLMYCAAGLLVASGVLLVLQYSASQLQVIFLVLIARLLTSFAGYIRAFFRAYGRTQYEALSALVGAGTLMFTSLLILRFSPGVLLLAGAWLFGAMVELAAAIYLFHRRVLRERPSLRAVRPRELRALSRDSMPFGLCAAGTLVYFYLDTVILSRLDTIETVARYTAAYNVILALILLPMIFVDALFPLLARRQVADSSSMVSTVSQLTRYCVLLVLPLGVGTVLLAEPIIRLLYGARYLGDSYVAGADTALAILIWDACLIFFTYLFGNVLAALNRQATVSWIAWSGAVLNVALNLLLIPRYSLVGAAVATVATEAFIATLLIWKLSTILALRFSFPVFSKALLSTVAMGVLLSIIDRHLSLAAAILIALAVYSGSLCLTGTLRREEMLFLRRYL